jgi:hypothetical protein
MPADLTWAEMPAPNDLRLSGCFDLLQCLVAHQRPLPDTRRETFPSAEIRNRLEIIKSFRVSLISQQHIAEHRNVNIIWQCRHDVQEDGLRVDMQRHFVERCSHCHY